ncbi:MAG TPA: hypothetical protein VGW38_28360 [Chloroflexota bacterium]|nr:hypothetical protein [Chloroflexota bacterium]
MGLRARSAIQFPCIGTMVVHIGDARQEAMAMDPNLIRPVMTSYLANRTKHPSNTSDDWSPEPLVGSLVRRSLVAKARQASGAGLISLGSRLSGAPQMAYTLSANETAGIAS